jgi:hypothetical protein
MISIKSDRQTTPAKVFSDKQANKKFDTVTTGKQKKRKG